LGLRFKVFFASPLPPEVVWVLLPPKLLSSAGEWVYGVDGKWLHRAGVILNHRDITNGENLWWSYHPSESFDAYHSDLIQLSKQLDPNYLPSGAISDWKSSGVSAITGNFGPVPHQRCLIHVQRSAKSLLPKNSTIPATLELREIAKEIIHLDDEIMVWNWQSKLIEWGIKYEKLLTIKTIGVGTQKKWWYTHGNLRRAWALLTKDVNPFFVYLDYPQIPRDNNSLEGVNSNLKQKLGDHRGMKLKQQTQFAFWYFTFSRAKNRTNLKKLWVGWKKRHNTRKPTQNYS
jgi:hypothetical protein